MTRDAISVQGATTPDGQFFATVGYPMQGRKANVTRITVSDDLPGLHCNMWRVRIYSGETVIWEGPLHNLEGVYYAEPEATQ